ncbi:O-antigen ligase family protein [Luteolibacter pohnpeiensis]|uniref:O-antigen ligase family protein n=1 Tax=Luteolibacter pohnpeiensis TaxID=454153 RepID=A0A934S3H4_9BACT|nr:O-antigen ligase family protein [Luteolibacter pohnpeiensis]MBK1882490.1 O-antigen ligase family protein [Luteolibacter pohnpeiensis]
MNIIPTVLLGISLILAVVIGPQMRSWTWGPALFVLGLAILSALPAVWKKQERLSLPGLLGFGIMMVAWFTWRAFASPVHEFAIADLMLLGGAAGSFIVTRTISNSVMAERILVWTIAGLLLASVGIIIKQVGDPSYNPVFPTRSTDLPAGFFRHYNDGANFLVGSSLVLAGAALFGRQGAITKSIWGLIALAGLFAVYWTRSRGGILAAGLGAGSFVGMALIVGKRRNSSWFIPIALSFPVILLALGYFAYRGLSDAQEKRFSSKVEAVVDNPIRLYLLSTAVTCISEHPIQGGGSRSFSWECFRAWDHEAYGYSDRRPEQVHNEIMQAATDYGLVGVLLLIGFIGTILVGAILRCLFSDLSSVYPVSTEALWVGGFAGFSGMFVQSCFSFVFHLLPGAMLLGICLARASHLPPADIKKSAAISKSIITVLSLGIAAFLIPISWKATQVLTVMWPTFTAPPDSVPADQKLKALKEAATIQPEAVFYREMGMLHQSEMEKSPGSAASRESLTEALADYTKAENLHPFDPLTTVNRANLLSFKGDDHAAEDEFKRAAFLQGGMESSFRSYYYYAQHLIQKAERQLSNGNPDAAFASASDASQQVSMVAKEMGWFMRHYEGMKIKLDALLAQGSSSEAANRPQDALSYYKAAAEIPIPSDAKWKAGVLLMNEGKTAYSKRNPEIALRDYLEALNYLKAAPIPNKVPRDLKGEYVSYLNRSIEFLRGAKIEPAKADAK